MVLAALCHDIARGFFSDENHAAVAAELLRPFVRPEVVWAVEVHSALTQRFYAPSPRHIPWYRYRFHRGARLAWRFADEWDQCSFDPAYPTFELEHFEPLIRRLVKHQARYPLK